MSYDLTVYGQQRIDADQLATLVESISGLSVGDGGTDQIMVLRGKRKSYSFTVFGPYRIEPEDLPEDVVPNVLDPTTSWQVIIEGSSPTEIASARRLAKALAQAARGVAVDEQTDEILGARKPRQIVPPSSELVRVLNISWWSPASAPHAPTVWLEVAKKFLPEALPRRYGGYEPFPYRLNRDGEGPFIAEYGPTGLRYQSQNFAASPPCLEGGLYGEPRGGVLPDTISVLAAPLDDPRWRNTVRRFFVEYARRRGSVLAVAEVQRNHKFVGQKYVTPLDASDRSGLLGSAAGILGLPANPVWLTWLGREYLRLVGKYLPPDRTTYYPEGALFAASEEPTDRGQLAGVPDPIPAELRVTAIPSKYGPINMPKNSPAAIRLPLGSD